MSLAQTLLTLVTPRATNAEQVGCFIDTLVVADALTTPNYVRLRSHVVQQLTRNHGYILLQQEITNEAYSVKLQCAQGAPFWLVFTNQAEFTIGVEYQL